MASPPSVAVPSACVSPRVKRTEPCTCPPKAKRTRIDRRSLFDVRKGMRTPRAHNTCIRIAMVSRQYAARKRRQEGL
eukprot:6198318-Pleurochrysis_carterae.AAC.1